MKKQQEVLGNEILYQIRLVIEDTFGRDHRSDACLEEIEETFSKWYRSGLKSNFVEREIELEF